MSTTDLPPLPEPARPRRLRRALLWGALVALLGVAQTLLVQSPRKVVQCDRVRLLCRENGLEMGAGLFPVALRQREITQVGAHADVFR